MNLFFGNRLSHRKTNSYLLRKLSVDGGVTLTLAVHSERGLSAFPAHFPYSPYFRRCGGNTVTTIIPLYYTPNIPFCQVPQILARRNPPKPSEAVRNHPKPSEAVRNRPKPAEPAEPAEAIRNRPKPSETIRSRPKPAEARRRTFPPGLDGEKAPSSPPVLYFVSQK